MPLYEYECECGNKEDVLLPYGEYDQLQVCGCGKTMQRIISLPTIGVGTELLYTRDGKSAFAKQMALDTINSKDGGFPEINVNKSIVQQRTFEGTQSKTKTVF